MVLYFFEWNDSTVLKKHDIERTFARQFFRRIRGSRQVVGTEQRIEYSREIDFAQARDNTIEAFACKLNPKKRDNGGREFREGYPDCPIHVVTPANLREFVEIRHS